MKKENTKQDQKEKNILLVYPKIPNNTYWSFSHALPFIGKKSSMPPLGLITVAAMLPSHYNLKLIDENTQKLRDRHLRWADAVFTSSMIVQKDSLENVIERANRINVPVVAGGPYPTQHYEKIRGHVAHFIIGEVESGTLEAFLDDFEKDTAKKAYARQVVRKKGIGREIDEQEIKSLESFFGSSADIAILPERHSMDQSPIPRYDLLDIKKYASMAIQFSRGCPIGCEFCNEQTLFGDWSRLKPSENFVKELRTIYDLGYRGSVFVVDDNFIGNIRKTKSALEQVIGFQKKNRYPFSFFTEASINLAKDERLMDLMRDAGFNMVFVGIESPDKDVLESMKKHINANTDIIEDIRAIQNKGMEVAAGMIVGNDNEPENIYARTAELCQKTGMPMAMVGQLTAVKGSELYEKLRKQERLREDTEGNNTHNFEFNFDPLPHKNESSLIEHYKTLMSSLYDKEGRNYFERCKKLMQNLGKDHPNSARAIGIGELRAFGLSALTQFFFRSYSKEYRKFLSWSIKNRPDLLSEAVALGIKGSHFMKITRTAEKADSLYHHISERYDQLVHRIESTVASGISESSDMYFKLIHEKDEFLSYARKKISKFPPDYRPRLIRAYQSISSSLDSMICNKRCNTSDL